MGRNLPSSAVKIKRTDITRPNPGNYEIDEEEDDINQLQSERPTRRKCCCIRAKNDFLNQLNRSVKEEF